MLRSKLVQAVRWGLAQQNLGLVRLNRQFGIEPFNDVRRVAASWGYRIGVVFDVGANVGQTAQRLLREFPAARVFSFEPHPSTYAKLVEEVPPSSRFRAVNAALGREAGEIEMMEYPDSRINSLAPNAQFAERFGVQGRSIRVQETTLDAYCEANSIGNVDLLKIDTEGFEMMVLEGCENMLRRRRINFIYVEYNDLQCKDGVCGGGLMPIDALLRPYGYRFIASYNDEIKFDGEMFSVSNALFALAPELQPAGAIN